MIRERNFLKKGEQINLKELFNLEENQNMERVLITILKDDDCQEGLVKITLKANGEEVSQVINRESAFFFGGYDCSNTSVECFITALKDSNLSISIELKNNKGEK